MGKATGFSLLELIIVVAMAALLAGTSVLSHQALRPGLNLSMATRQVVMDLKVARLRSVAEHINHRIVFAAAGTSYQPQRKFGSVYKDESAAVPLPAGIVVTGCTAGGSAISFVPRGAAGSFGTVTLQNTKGDVRRIVVDIAGQVRVQ